MHDELEQLEAELGRLRPVAPAARVDHAIAKKLTTVAHARVVEFAWLAWPAAAAIAVVFALASRPARPDGNGIPDTPLAMSGPEFKPVSAENLLLASADEGAVTLADGTPARRVRRAYLDTITWKNPQTKASLTWTVPREEVRVTPVDFQ